MNPKNTLKFISIVVAVGFFGSIIVGGPSTGNLAELSAPTSLSASALLAQSGTRNSVPLGSSASVPAVFRTINDVHFEFSLPSNATKMSVTLQGGDLRGSSSIVVPAIFDLTDLPSGIIDSIVPDQVYELRAISCDDYICSRNYASFFFTVTEGIVPVETPVIPTIVSPDFIVTANCSNNELAQGVGNLQLNRNININDNINDNNIVFERNINNQIVEPGDCIFVWNKNSNVWENITPQNEPVVSPAVPTEPSNLGQTISNFLQNIQNVVAGVVADFVNFIQNLFGFGSGDPNKTGDPTIQSVGNLEIVRTGPGSQNIDVTISPSASNQPVTIMGTQDNSCGTDCYSKLAQVNSSPSDQPSVDIIVSNVPSSYGNFAINVYDRDANPTNPNLSTHGQEHNYILSYQNTCSYYSGSSATCKIQIPNTAQGFGELEVWIEPTSCGQDGQLGLFNNPQATASIISTSPASSKLGPVTVSAQTQIPSGISYDVNLGYDLSAQVWPQGNETYFSCTSTTCDTLGSTKTSLQLSGNVPTVSPFSAGVKIQKNIQGYSFAQIGTAQPAYSTCNVAFWGQTPQGNFSPDAPITPGGEVPTPSRSITVVKVTAPASDPQDFNFSLSGPPPFNSTTYAPGQTTLDTDSGSSTPSTYTFSSLPAGNYSLQENLPAGWKTTSVVCTGAPSTLITPQNLPITGPGSPSASMTLPPTFSGNVTCTFTNTKIETPTITSCEQDMVSGKLAITGPTVQNVSSTVKNLLGKVTVTGSIPSNTRYLSQIGYTNNNTNSSTKANTQYIPSGFPITGTQIVDWAGNAAQVTPPTGSYRPYIYVCKQQSSGGGGLQSAQVRQSLPATWSNIGECCNQDGGEGTWFQVQPEPTTTSCAEDLPSFSFSNLQGSVNSSTGVATLNADVAYSGPTQSGYSYQLQLKYGTNPGNPSSLVSVGASKNMAVTNGAQVNLNGQTSPIPYNTTYYGVIELLKISASGVSSSCYKSPDIQFIRSQT